jgi:hypothetical protein
MGDMNGNNYMSAYDMIPSLHKMFDNYNVVDCCKSCLVQHGTHIDRVIDTPKDQCHQVASTDIANQSVASIRTPVAAPTEIPKQIADQPESIDKCDCCTNFAPKGMRVFRYLSKNNTTSNITSSASYSTLIDRAYTETNVCTECAKDRCYFCNGSYLAYTDVELIPLEIVQPNKIVIKSNGYQYTYTNIPNTLINSIETLYDQQKYQKCCATCLVSKQHSFMPAIQCKAFTSTELHNKMTDTEKFNTMMSTITYLTAELFELKHQMAQNHRE